MIRNLKVLSLALVAALAMTAVATSSASAQFTFTADEYPAHIEGQDTEIQNGFTLFGNVVTCDKTTTRYDATLGGASELLTLEPTFKNCTAGGGNLSLTVTMNSCGFDFHVEKKVDEHEFIGGMTIECDSPGEQITIDYYSIKDTKHTTVLCQIHIPQQHLEESIRYTLETGDEKSTDTLKIEGASAGNTVDGITMTRTKGIIPGCEVHAHTEHAIYHLNITLEGFNEAEEHNGLRID